MVLGIQIVGFLFGVFMIYYSFLHYKRKEFTNKEYFVWLILWIIFIFFAILPNSLDFLIKDTLDLTRPLDFFIIAGFMTLIAMIFYTYILVRVTQRKVERIVSKLAKQKKL